MECDVKMTAAQLIMNMKELDYLKDISIPSIKERVKNITTGIEGEDYDIVVWSYTIAATLIDSPTAQFEAK